MAPRNRKKENRDLAGLNLYHRKVKGHTYYQFRHPVTGRFYPMGTDRAKAKASARILMDRLAQDQDLVRRVIDGDDISMADLIGDFRRDYLPGKGLTASTLKNYEYRLNRIERDIGDRGVRQLGIKEIAEYLDEHFTRDAYVKHRGVLIELFRFAKVKGRYPAERDNPAEVTYAKSDYEKERQRLTLDQFKAIHAIAPGWMQIAMELSLVTLQGRHEVLHMKYEDQQGGYIYVVRQKTRKNEWARLRIKITPAIKELIERSRQDAMASPYVIHRRPAKIKRRKDTDHWSQIPAHWFSQKFAEYRDETKLFDGMDSLQRPTFHEIRALGSWLYEQAGYPRGYVQALMAHGDEKMTKHYQDGHAEKWMDVEAGLELKGILG